MALAVLVLVLAACQAGLEGPGAPTSPSPAAQAPATGTPTPTTTPTAARPTPTATATPRPTVVAPPEAPEVPEPPAAFPSDMVELAQKPLLLRQGRLVPAAEGLAQGTVEHLRMPAGKRLRLSPDFRVQAEGVVEMVLLAEGADGLAAGHPLARLRAAEGGQEYPVPADLAFQRVVLYDREGRRVLAEASLGPEPACESVQEDVVLIRENPAEVDLACLRVDPVASLGRTGVPPDVDMEAYRLRVEGEVDRPLEWTLADLERLPHTSEINLLVCSGFFADVAEWSGVPLAAVLEAAQVREGAGRVRVSGLDGYTWEFPLEDVLAEGVFLATQVNGQPLPPEHGYPVRLVVRGAYGTRWVKWVHRILVLP
ncbi:MAG: molybdopterin-dependent oxidoreductase [Anaerolineae bacterium]|nr:molybdopterin-dependent oxidoreductase [Anaerolineae bacterium]